MPELCLLSRGTHHSRCGVSRQRRAQYANKKSSGTVLGPNVTKRDLIRLTRCYKARPDPLTARNLHAAYGLFEIKAAFGIADLARSGPTGTGVIHLESQKTYIHLVTFRKEERDFAPTTRYKDYLISRSKLHWESQAAATQASKSGQNYIHFQERGYTILFFARLDKRIEGETSPFIFLGPAAQLCSHKGDRPISMVWDLAHPAPADLFEAARVG